jgi:hypothetical protein
MTEEHIRILEIGVAGIVVTMAAYFLGMFRAELLGIVFCFTTAAGQTVVAFLEQIGGTIGSGRTDPPS